jgi:hypothetical protein
MTDHSFDKVAVAMEKQGKAFKTFRERQDERFDDVTKRIDEIEARGTSPGEFAVTDLAGYSQMFDACADLVESSPHPRLLAAALLNAAISINLCTSGAEALASGLRIAADRLPAEQAKAQGGMN